MSRFCNGDRLTVGLHDADKTQFPNLALMKLSAFYKAQGEDVRWWIPLEKHDIVASSKVFTFTPEEPMLPADAIKGGTGYGNMDELPKCIDKVSPDYSLYRTNQRATGFCTMGKSQGNFQHC